MVHNEGLEAVLKLWDLGSIECLVLTFWMFFHGKPSTQSLWHPEGPSPGLTDMGQG